MLKYGFGLLSTFEVIFIWWTLIYHKPFKTCPPLPPLAGHPCREGAALNLNPGRRVRKIVET